MSTITTYGGIMTDNHSDPISEGFAQSGQRLVQVISLGAIWQQTHARRKQRLQDAQAAKDAALENRVANEMKAAFEQARSQWAPAHDEQWLRQADLLQIARAWAAALPYAGESTAAAAAVRKCEERLRELHPHAMEHYDRFRSKGMSPEDALREAVPFFTRDPHVRTGHSSPERRRLDAGTGTEWTATDHGPTRQDWEEHQQEQRGHRIVHARVRLDPEVQPHELRTALANDTNLPEHLIAKITSPDDDALARGLELHGASAERQRATALGHTTDNIATRTVDERMAGLAEANRATVAADTANARSIARSPAQVAADDFPLSIREAMQLTAQRQHEQASPRRPRTPNPDRNRRNGR
jgi:hypothetical protein